MQPIQTLITGEEAQGDLTRPTEALTQFYFGFNHRDLGTLADNWSQTEEAAMDNPLGGVMRGWEAIRSVYERIMRGPSQVFVEFYDYTIHETAEMFYAVGRERGFLRGPQGELRLSIRTTRLFRKYDDRWKQAHHHGSIEDPELLRRYQAMVRGETA